MATESLQTACAPMLPGALRRLLGDLRLMGARAALERVSPKEVFQDPASHASPDRRTRFELAATEAQLVVLVIWLPGQFSPAHDHGGSACTSRVLRGVATEQRFERAAGDRVRVVEEDRFLPGSIVSCDGADIHALGNDATNTEPLVTLHAYLPRPVMNEYTVEAGGAS